MLAAINPMSETAPSSKESSEERVASCSVVRLRELTYEQFMCRARVSMADATFEDLEQAWWEYCVLARPARKPLPEPTL